MLNANTVVASLIWGSIGFGFALIGWRRKRMGLLFGGVALMAISYFIASALYMSLVSVVLVALSLWLNSRED